MKTFKKSHKAAYQNWFLYLASTVFILSLFVGAAVLNADTGNEDQHGKPLEVVLQEIREKYEIDPDEAINPRNLSKEDLEELGEAVMSTMIPDPEEHRDMDDMMGGEGSRRLAWMHRRIGSNYLEGRSTEIDYMMGGSSGGSTNDTMHGSSDGRRGDSGGMMGGMM